MLRRSFASSVSRLNRARQAQRYRRRIRFLRHEVLESRRVLTVDPQLLGDIGVNSANVEEIVEVGADVFFVASREDVGIELWKTDGTTEGTVLVKDIRPGIRGGHPRHLTNVGGTVFFRAGGGVYGEELWKSDGTEQGTVLVKDIRPGDTGSYPDELTDFGGVLFFRANHGTYGRELWKSDGTEQGTVLVKNIRTGSLDSFPDQLTVSGGTLFFRATGNDGQELWKSDGTELGTVQVKDINPSGSSGPFSLTDVGGTLFFEANDGTNGEELWKSDGTEVGTVLVKDINTSGHSFPGRLTNVDGTLFFRATDGTSGDELWKSDGTELGTVRVKDINSGSDDSLPQQLTAVGSALFFVATDGSTGYELWTSDGTENGTVLVKDINSGSGDSFPFWITDVDGTAFFSAYDPVRGSELWKSDGSTAGTVLVKELEPGQTSSYPSSLTNVGGELLFSAIEDGKVGLHKSDGTEGGTTLLRSFVSEETSFPTDFTAVGGTVFFEAADGSNGYELWKTDGTQEGTVLVKNIYTEALSGSYPRALTDVDGTLFFQATDVEHNTELWKSDGTAEGTVLVKDINPGSDYYSSPYYLTKVDGTLFFSADDGVHGYELWKSDGTTDGTVLVKDINPGPDHSVPFSLVNVEGTLFFAATDGVSGYELWKSDGTAEGTVLVKDINPGPDGSVPYNLTNFNGTLIFTADDGTGGTELWKSDGTSEGTVLVKDINPGPDESEPYFFTELNGKLFFNADDGTNGYELWETDGTAAGTVLVKDINPNGSSEPRSLTVLNDTLFFVADDDSYGNELWKSDGTTAGTLLVKDILPGPDTSSPEYLTPLNGLLFFSADDEVNGNEVWQSDGTLSGTIRVTDIAPGELSSFPSYLVATNGQLFFNASDGVTGMEPWSFVAPNTVILPQGGGTNEIELVGGDLVIRDDGGNIVYQEPLSGVDQLYIQGQDDVDDNLVIQFDDGNPIPAGGIIFDGGAGGVDSLELLDGDAMQDADTIRYRATNESDGFVDFDLDGSGGFEGTITYTGLEPIVDTLDAVNRVFQFTDATASGETITLSDDGGTQSGVSTIDSSAAEVVSFTNPTSSLVIETATGDGAGADQITVMGLDPQFAADIKILGDSDDTVRFSANTNTGGGALFVTGKDIPISAPLLSSGGEITLLAENDITFSGLGMIDTESGTAGVMLQADSDGQGGGGISMVLGSQVNARSGDLVISATDAIELTKVITTGEAEITSTNGAITTTLSTPALVASKAVLRAGQGVNLVTQVSQVAATTTANDIMLTNQLPGGGNLAITTVDGLAGVSNDAGSVAIKNSAVGSGSAPLTISANIVAAGTISLTSVDQIGDGDNLTVTAGATVESTSAGVAISAGDKFIAEAGTAIVSGGLIEISVDPEMTADGNDPDTAGGILTVAGRIDASTAVKLNGGDDADSFAVTPTAGSSGPIAIRGNDSADDYKVGLGALGGPVDIVELEDEGDDSLEILGTGVGDKFSVSSEQTTSGLELVTYKSHVESLEIASLAGEDTIVVTPSKTLEINVLGGDPGTGLGDRLGLNTPPGESSSSSSSGPGSGTISVSGGYQPIVFAEIETLRQLEVSLTDSSISENGGSTTATVSRMETDGELTVTLVSGDPNQVQVITTVKIPDGKTISPEFTIQALDNDILDGSRPIVIEASAEGFVDGTESVSVTDFEALSLDINEDSISELGGVATATVSRTDPLGELVVTLSSGDDSEAKVTQEITIPDGKTTSEMFNIVAEDDSLLDGVQTVSISAKADGYQGDSESLDVTDFEALTIDIDADSISESGGLTTATVSRTDPTGNLQVSLMSDDKGEATVVATVMIPDGKTTSDRFNVVAEDDVLLDGTQTVTITAKADGYVDGSQTVEVTDLEELTLTINAQAISEAGGMATASVSRPGTGGALLVSLVSDDPEEAKVTASVMIPAGKTDSDSFLIMAEDDALLDGTQVVTITAQADGYQSGLRTVQVTDLEELSLQLDDSSISELGGVTTGTVTRTDPAGDLVVTLMSDDKSEAKVLATVTIEDGKTTSESFEVTAEDDTELDGTQTVTITAAADGYQSSSQGFEVTDFEALELLLDAGSIPELEGKTMATVSRPDSTGDLLVNLMSDDPGEARVITSITIPDGKTSSESFLISGEDDDLLDGTQTATITAKAGGYEDAAQTIEITDVEELSLAIAKSTISENGGSTTATVTRTDPTGDLTVDLQLSSPGGVNLPTSIKINDGFTTSAPFTIDATDDTLLDGSQVAEITASAGGYIQTKEDLLVTDFETLTLTLTENSIGEAGGMTSGMITRSNTDNQDALTVSLSTNDETELDLPMNVEIPAGKSSVEFQVLALDDEVVDGVQMADIQVEAIGYVPGETVLEIQDNPRPWHNWRRPLDVNRDNEIVPGDVLIVVNEINLNGPRELITPLSGWPSLFYDSTGDGFLAPGDVLVIVNHLNGDGEGEGEALLPAGIELVQQYSTVSFQTEIMVGRGSPPVASATENAVAEIGLTEVRFPDEPVPYPAQHERTELMRALAARYGERDEMFEDNLESLLELLAEDIQSEVR